MRTASIIVVRSWLLLLLITCLGALFVERANFPQLSVPIILLLALLKVRLVFLDFMELRSAPFFLRSLLELWAVVVTVMILSIYLGAL